MSKTTINDNWEIPHGGPGIDKPDDEFCPICQFTRDGNEDCKICELIFRMEKIYG